MREAQLKSDDRCILVIAHAISLNQIVSRSNHLSKSNRLDGVMAIASTCHPVAVVNCIHFDWNALMSCSKYNMLQHVVYLDIARRTSSFRKMDWCRRAWHEKTWQLSPWSQIQNQHNLLQHQQRQLQQEMEQLENEEPPKVSWSGWSDRTDMLLRPQFLACFVLFRMCLSNLFLVDFERQVWEQWAVDLQSVLWGPKF